MAAYVSSSDKKCQEKSFEFNICESEKENDKNVCCDINSLNTKDNSNERSVFYKKPIKKNNYKLEIDFNDTPQEIRRQRILYYQKKNRDASFNARRGLLEEIFNSENEEEMEEEMQDEEEEMEVDPIRKRRYKPRREYAQMLMLSEWMLEVPQDFADNWIMIPCPLGKRVLVVACKGITKVYSRRGILLFTFETVLPGGSSSTFRNNYTILDCIWLNDKKIFYALDVLAWSNQEMLNCEAEFRFYWLKTQLDEISEIKEQISGVNDYPILTLPTVKCDQDFYECLQNISAFLPLDGLLFFHKEAHYTSGRTPLVTWLKTYMLPEVLGMSVPEPYDEKPSNYIDFEHHVLNVIQNEKKWRENMKKNKKWSKSEEELME